MNPQVPFSFALELCIIVVVIGFGIRAYRMHRRIPLAKVLANVGMTEDDIVKVPKATLVSWRKEGVSRSQFVASYRLHVENQAS